VGKRYEGIDGKMAGWLAKQPVFFVATAPLAGDGLLNLSPKGLLGTFRVLDDHTVAYLDLTGSGVETLAHLRENGRIVLMFCAFDGPPRVVRLWGRGEGVLPGHPDFAGLVAGFPEHVGTRSVIRVAVSRVQDSCGYAVPRMALVQERDILDLHHAKRGPGGLVAYRAERNATSLDGLPGLD
jgi:hypothetical protein